MTWADLKAAVAFRLNRPDLPDAFIEYMAGERVTFYGPQIFTPAETIDNSITLQPGQQFYPLPAGTQQVNFVRVLFNGVWIPVNQADRYTDMLTVDVLQPPFVSLPVSLYRQYGTQLRVFPAPNAQYPIELTIDATIAAPTQDDDAANYWVNDGRVLLINSTMLEICREYLDVGVASSPRIINLTQTTNEAFEKLMMNAHMISSPSIMRQYL